MLDCEVGDGGANTDWVNLTRAAENFNSGFLTSCFKCEKCLLDITSWLHSC